jgi:hypothetical protein
MTPEGLSGHALGVFRQTAKVRMPKNENGRISAPVSNTRILLVLPLQDDIRPPSTSCKLFISFKPGFISGEDHGFEPSELTRISDLRTHPLHQGPFRVQG